MYNAMYQPYNPQATLDRINSQIAELEKMKSQLPTTPISNNPPAINQTFQLASNSTGGMRYVASIDDVNKEIVIGDTPFFSKDLSVLWIKNSKNEVKTYELQEIIQKDEKDLQIEFLQAQIEQLKKGEVYAKSNDTDVDESVESKKSSNVSSNRTSKTKSK